MAEKLIRSGTDVNIVDEAKCERNVAHLCRGGTALHWAVKLGKKTKGNFAVFKRRQIYQLTIRIHRTN